MNTIKQLETWFYSHCDNDWEHDHMITIYNLDNPGWGVKIDLKGTLLEEIKFDPIEHGDSEDRKATWIKCTKQETIFTGLGSYDMLDTILCIFLNWANNNTDTSLWDDLVLRLVSDIKTLSKDPPNNVVDRLRSIYKDIEDIPTEHPQKRELLDLFDEVWQQQWK